MLLQLGLCQCMVCLVLLIIFSVMDIGFGDVLDFGGLIIGREGAKDQINANIEMMHAQNAFNAEQAGIQRDWQASQVELNRQWQERMSSSAVSRRMADLRASGINPILAGKFDASTPGGAVLSGASAQSSGLPEIPNVATSAFAGLQASREYRMFREQLENTKATRRKINNEADRIEADKKYIESKTGIAAFPQDMSEFLSMLFRWITGRDQREGNNALIDLMSDYPRVVSPEEVMYNLRQHKKYKKLPGVKDSQRKEFPFGKGK